MSQRDKRTIEGIVAELEVQMQFTKDPNLLVFVPLMGLGLVDIVTLNRKTGEFKAYDVKARSIRKSDYLAKYVSLRRLKCKTILRPRSDEQKRLGVEIIYPIERQDHENVSKKNTDE
jgi:hypothetical protein